ncbi:phage tail protein [Aminobacter anthyllidis]|uniref:Phage tail protein n=1 Tax=Aminobacter anthyllidis TaxID=1035067 RepID=A0A9X1AFN7_9HYPH|nr:phage tail protein [Aminobacter anthyllidis]MBT1158864.1 phage tail protein [Aminobacter anthyllidis]
MVKTPKTRHSKTHREPVTIELEPGAVSRVEEPGKPEAEAEAVSATTGDEAMAAAETRSAETAAKAESGYASYDYSFDNEKAAEKPKAEASTSTASSNAGSGAASAASAAPTSTAPARQSTSGLLPGLAGGLIALLVAGGLQYAGVLGSAGGAAGTAGDEQTQAEIASLKSQLADLGAAASGGSELKGQVEGLTSAVNEVKVEIEALKSAPAQAGSSEVLAGLDGRIKQIETAVTSLSQNSGASSEIATLNERVAGLDAAVKSAGEAATADDGKIATLEQSVSALTSKVEAQASQPKIALAIAASALKAAVDRGAGFGAELETFAAISPEAPELAALRAHAEKGVATRADIIAETDAAANAMIAAAKPVSEDAGILERLVSSAEQLVQVRPIGAVEGTGVPETVARMEVAVTQGDFAKALAEYDTLPDTAKAAGADFITKLKARLDVETLVDKLVAGAMKA